MKKLLLALALCFISSTSFAQCNGTFAPNTFCGNNTTSTRPPFAITGGISLYGPTTSTSGDVAVWQGSVGNQLGDSGILNLADKVATFTGTISQTVSTNFYTNGGGIVDNFNDRFFVGGATVNNGSSIGNQDWLSVFQLAAGLGSGTIVSAQAAATTNNSTAAAVGFLAASQSKFSTSASPSTIGLASFALNNNTTYKTGAFAYYGECHAINSAVGGCVGMEIEPRALAAQTFADPYTQGSTVGHQVGCGAGLSISGEFPCSAAIQIVYNPEPYYTGINVLNGSITSGGGAGGTTPAISLPAGYHILWDLSAGTFGGSQTVNNLGGMIWKATAYQWLNSAGANILDFGESLTNTWDFATPVVGVSFTATTSFVLPPHTIPLPTCNGPIAGNFWYITNGVSPATYNAIVSQTISGTTPQPVFCNGTNWTYH